MFSCHVHQSRHDVTIFYDNVAWLQIAQYVNSRHWDNFSTQHSFWISQYTLYFINLNRNSFQITLIENTDRYFYLEMHSVLSGFKDHRRFNIFFREIIDVHCTKNMEYLLSGNYVLYRDKETKSINHWSCDLWSSCFPAWSSRKGWTRFNIHEHVYIVTTVEYSLRNKQCKATYMYDE